MRKRRGDMSSTAAPGRASFIEEHHIDFIPLDERHGTPRSLFYVWFAANFVIGTIITGALAVLVGNNLFWAVVSVVVGNLLGAVFMAYHSAQGPKLGVPQLIQSRGQFGFHGALLPVALAIILYVGFFAAGIIPAAQGLHILSPGISVNWAIVIIGIPSLILAGIGYDLIHIWMRVGILLFLAGFVILTVAVLNHGGMDWSTSGFSGGAFLLSVSIIAVFQISYAPYVSDYSRYLPAKIGINPPFWATYIGTNLSAIWLMIVACILTVQYSDLGTVDAMNAVIGGVAGKIVLLTVAFGIVGVNAMNLYGGMLSLITALSSATRIRPGVLYRAAFLLLMFAGSMILAIAGSGNFMTNYLNFLLLLLYLFIPWTAINLTDFYFVRKGRYDIEGFFEPKGIYYEDRDTWTYYGISWKAMIAYAIGVAVQVPFMNTTWWKGWAVDSLSGADLAWIIGLPVSALSYYLLARREVVASDEVAVSVPVSAEPTAAP
jgi:NCS1 family nucleobase:cation symporter-1